MQVSSGIVFIYNRKMLLIHPRGKQVLGGYSFPKGHSEEGEDIKETACREVFEEIGIKVKPSQLKEEPILVPLKDKKGKIYKIVHLFVMKIKELGEIGLKSEVVPTSQIQEEEVQSACFYDYADSLILLHPAYLPFTKLIE